MLNVFIGYDRREARAYQVAVKSLTEHASRPVRVQPILESHVRGLGLYTRPHEVRNGALYDPISAAGMSTQFAVTRFLVPHLVDDGWALFADVDFLFRADIADLFELADPKYAVMVVKHDHAPTAQRKMDNQIQTVYPRKNWSSLVLWNCGHPAHEALTLEKVNGLPGRDLHAFCWLADDLIGSIPKEWNWLCGDMDDPGDVKAVHYTNGTPDMLGTTMPYSDQWWAVADSLPQQVWHMV